MAFIRYIRDHLNGSRGNGASYWVEIKAFNEAGTNIASGKTVTANFTPSEGVLTQVTNDDTNTNNYVASPDANSYVTIDLGAAYDITSITRWHYNGDGRTFYDTKTETSADGETWTTIFDSAVSGTYAEQAEGKNDATIAPPVYGGAQIDPLVHYYKLHDAARKAREDRKKELKAAEKVTPKEKKIIRKKRTVLKLEIEKELKQDDFRFKDIEKAVEAKGYKFDYLMYLMSLNMLRTKAIKNKQERINAEIQRIENIIAEQEYENERAEVLSLIELLH